MRSFAYRCQNYLDILRERIIYEITNYCSITFPSLAFSYDGSTFDDVWSEIEAKPYAEFTETKVTLKSFAGYAKEESTCEKCDENCFRSKIFYRILQSFFTLTEFVCVVDGKLQKKQTIVDISKRIRSTYNLKSLPQLFQIPMRKFSWLWTCWKNLSTMNPSEKVKTANFFQIDNLIGTYAKRYSDVTMTMSRSYFLQ